MRMSAMSGAEAPGTVRSLVPARMDRLPWSRFHTRVILGLGAAWILDGLEIQIVNTAGTVLQHKETLNLSSTEVGLLASVYLAGEVVGALVFGRISDLVGRRKILLLTLITYLLASGISRLSVSL